MIRTFLALIGMALLTMAPVICGQKHHEKSKRHEQKRSPLEVLGHQLMLQQLAAQESVRSRGSSGLKESPENIMYDNLADIRTVGLGEFNAVLNGVEFRVRQNNYTLHMPHTTSSEYDAVELIPFPPVPPAVQDQPTIEDQIIEMQEWFKAWDKQDFSERDYRDYFKAVLCYLEGAWTTTVDEKFMSPLEGPHFLDVNDFGHSAYSPIAVLKMDKDTPVLAEWHYRILCHPVKRDLPLNRFQIVDDVTTRMREGLTVDELAQRPTSRFQLTSSDSDEDQQTFLDELMAEIPGKDNYQSQLVDERFSKSRDNEEPNTAYYHRTNDNARNDAQGSHSSSLSDRNLFVAKTSQSQVAGRDVEVCSEDDQNDCTVQEEKLTYAIPVEVIYLTPLSKWNPYNIPESGSSDDINPSTTPKTYFRTPDSFFRSNEGDADVAPLGAIWVQGGDGIAHPVHASGVRIMFPSIQGVGKIRQRYPIMPIVGEGSAVWKNLNAIDDSLDWTPVTQE